MKKTLIYAFTLSSLLVGLGSCKKDYGPNGIGPLQDSLADVPVTVTNQEFFERVPIVTASLTKPVPGGAATARGPFTITFRIPSDKGTIREIRQIQTGAVGLSLLATGAPIQAFNFDGSATAPALRPIAGNGTNEITFTSSLADYTTYRTRILALPAATRFNPGNDATLLYPNATFNAQNPNQLRFFFKLTLENGQEIVPMEVRVRITP